MVTVNSDCAWELESLREGTRRGGGVKGLVFDQPRGCRYSLGASPRPSWWPVRGVQASAASQAPVVTCTLCASVTSLWSFWSVSAENDKFASNVAHTTVMHSQRRYGCACLVVHAVDRGRV
jgi:hypothetical protein